MIEWRRVPWPLWIYIALGLVGVIGDTLLGPSHQLGPRIAALVILIAWDIGLLRGIRWLWMLAVGINVFFVALNLTLTLALGSAAWFAIGVYLIIPALLLLPNTRRFFAKPERSKAQASASPS